MSLTEADYAKCADRISAALRFQPGESVLLKVDTRLFTPIVEPLRARIRAAGAYVAGAILSEETDAASDRELRSMRRLFDDSDVFIWLPELHQGSTPSVRRALDEWLDAKRGRSVHFHWASGTYGLPGLPEPPPDIVDGHYLRALDVPSAAIEAQHDRAIQILRSAGVRVATPEGTDIWFEVGDRPFSKQTGDASLAAARAWTLRIDRDVEIPSGVLRVAPIEESANGRILLPAWTPRGRERQELLLTFRNGRVTSIEGKGAEAVAEELDNAGGDARRFREFALGFNPALAIDAALPYIGYYGYGAGVVRLSLGDNLEMGGANRGGGVYWNFFPNATVTAGDHTLVTDGVLNKDLRVRYGS